MENDLANLEPGIALLALCIFVLLFIFGGVKTFKRNLVAALLCLIFLSPIWTIWAIVELFTGKIKPKVYNVVVKNDD
tara:strand:- start:726 stop:956 length:231 start_codon:yes stop_codon:yes gene_type:complete